MIDTHQYKFLDLNKVNSPSSWTEENISTPRGTPPKKDVGRLLPRQPNDSARPLPTVLRHQLLRNTSRKIVARDLLRPTPATALEQQTPPPVRTRPS